ncbi:uncharacterized protein ATNIH1004_011741 [Aspergillus tanneri]|uniref:Uncharacterized protein n=1 Tax=Aspergillus tanneri TaxID=1220188 RepID=A0A5M9M3P6_9EURO|nr:uncharacterized protein ATNIH1004_011741 [Aspergillus tanneri]KAA8641605.1 hypothetical protein ATNIH1004_011741 [Aspergillus tanneri]
MDYLSLRNRFHDCISRERIVFYLLHHCVLLPEAGLYVTLEMAHVTDVPLSCWIMPAHLPRFVIPQCVDFLPIKCADMESPSTAGLASGWTRDQAPETVGDVVAEGTRRRSSPPIPKYLAGCMRRTNLTLRL